MLSILKERLDDKIRTIDTINRTQRTELHKQNISIYNTTNLKHRYQRELQSYSVILKAHEGVEPTGPDYKFQVKDVQEWSDNR